MAIQSLFGDLIWIWVASEILLQVVTRTSRSTGQLKDRGSLLILFPVVFASTWWAMWYGDTHPHTMLGGAHWLRTAGLVLLILGLAIRWTAILTLGATFSTNVAIHAAQTLRTTGPYRSVRHPSYTGMLVIFTAIGLHERKLIVGHDAAGFAVAHDRARAAVGSHDGRHAAGQRLEHHVAEGVGVRGKTKRSMLA
jgi:protein-S-isoprenylcysteine O-methyltransferase Ste14